VVEDDPSVRQSLVQGLEAFGCLVIEADSGERAWALFTSSDVSCIVTEMVMPGISGKQLAERVRHTPTGADLPIFVLTGYSHGAELDEARPLGRKILKEPLSLVALHRTLSWLLDGQQRAAGRS
jgi:CheY-like chemotaxis protein